MILDGPGVTVSWEDMGADESQLEILASGARQSLSDSWGVQSW